MMSLNVAMTIWRLKSAIVLMSWRTTSDNRPTRTHINPYHWLILNQQPKDIEKVSPRSNLLTLVNSLTKSIKEARGSLDFTKQLFGGKNASEKQLTEVVNAVDVANGSKQLLNHYTNTGSTYTRSATMSSDDDSQLEPPPSQVSSIEYTYYLCFPLRLSPSPPPVVQLLSPKPPAENHWFPHVYALSGMILWHTTMILISPIQIPRAWTLDHM